MVTAGFTQILSLTDWWGDGQRVQSRVTAKLFDGSGQVLGPGGAHFKGHSGNRVGDGEGFGVQGQPFQ